MSIQLQSQVTDCLTNSEYKQIAINKVTKNRQARALLQYAAGIRIDCTLAIETRVAMQL